MVPLAEIQARLSSDRNWREGGKRTIRESWRGVPRLALKQANAEARKVGFGAADLCARPAGPPTTEVNGFSGLVGHECVSFPGLAWRRSEARCFAFKLGPPESAARFRRTVNSATSRAHQPLCQSAEDRLPGVPCHESHNQSSTCLQNLGRYSNEVVEKRAELHFE